MDNPEVRLTRFIGTPLEITGTLMLDQPPMAPNGRTLIPIRALADTYNILIKWDEAAREAILRYGDLEIHLPVGSKVVTLVTRGPNPSSRTVTIDEPVRIENGRTLIPLRFVAETFEFEVGWDDALRQITIEGDVQ